MKKLFVLLTFLCICLVFSSQAFAPQSTWVYNGGSGTQIVVTYSGSSFTIGANSYYQPLRVDWSTPTGPHSVAVYGSSFTPYCNCNFVISGRNATSSSASYYNYQ